MLSGCGAEGKGGIGTVGLALKRNLGISTGFFETARTACSFRGGSNTSAVGLHRPKVFRTRAVAPR